MLEGVFIDQTIEVLFQCAGHCRRSSRAWTIDQALDPLAGKTMDPLAESGIGKGEGVRDGLETLPFHDVAHGLGTAEDTGFFGLLDEGVSGRERVSGKVQFEGPHLRVSSNKLLQKYEHPPSHDVVTLLSAHNLSDSNFPEAALCHRLGRMVNNLTYMDPPALSRGSREEKHISGQMQSYIRPLCEGIVYLRALMKSAPPLLNKASASKAGSRCRVWGSRSGLSCHHLDHTSHRAGGFLSRFAATACWPLSSVLPGKTLDNNSCLLLLSPHSITHGTCSWL